MAERYANIEQAFPEEIKGEAFPYFLDWLKYNVVLVEITAYSDDNAYTIFESMNELLQDPFLRAYKDDPRFIAFAQKVGVVPKAAAKQ